MRHLNSGTALLALSSTGTLLFKSAWQRAERQSSRAETLSTAGPRMNFRATPGGEAVRGVGGRRRALTVRLHIRPTAVPGRCEGLCAGGGGDVYHLDARHIVSTIRH